MAQIQITHDLELGQERTLFTYTLPNIDEVIFQLSHLRDNYTIYDLVIMQVDDIKVKGYALYVEVERKVIN